MSSAQHEISQGDRFAFGANWQSFLETINDERILIAEDSLKDLLQESDLTGKTFLDLGSGSGLSSLCARRMGAKVHSFDFDPESVACTRELKERYFPEDKNWVVESGSILDKDYIASLGKFDILYSWGVLHHTGDMWQAIENTLSLVNPNCKIALAIYNDQGLRSALWLQVKKTYCSGKFGRWIVKGLFIPWFTLRTILLCILRGQNEFAAYRRNRGMSIMHDWIDWLGGLPFEVADPAEIRIFYEVRKFRLAHLIETPRLGCNQFLLVRSSAPSRSQEIPSESNDTTGNKQGYGSDEKSTNNIQQDSITNHRTD